MRVLLVQPSLAPPGGGHLVAAWMLEALRDEHDVTLLTWARPDLARVNRTFGTTLETRDFALLQPAPGLRRLLDRSPIPAALVKHALLMRRARAIADRHDVLLTADNETDFGRPGIQYVHYPKLDPERPAADLRWYHGSRRLLAAYRRLARRIGGLSEAGLRSNATLVNSAFIAERMRALHGVDSIVLHPPVPGVFPDVPWTAREDGVVAIGRLSPEKRIEDVVRAVALARERGALLRLHVIGSAGDHAYARDIRELIRRHASWASLHEDVARAELVRIVAGQRYGMHAMVGEHFGIAVAEMLRAGCIPLVHDSGGPPDIVGGDPRLLFHDPVEASERLLAVHGDPVAQDEIRTQLAARAELFSCERFVAELRRIVAAR